MFKKNKLLGLSLSGALIMAAPAAFAHFQMLLPDTALLQPKGGDLSFEVVFSHPVHGAPSMAMGTPQALYMVSQRGKDGEPQRTDLLDTLEPMQFTGIDNTPEDAFRLVVPHRAVRSLGDYIFALEPAPYYEASEDRYIRQFTKTIVNTGGVPGAWDAPVGLPVEILPLDKPYANWQGGVFRGVVLAQNKPVPFAEIEVEYVNYPFSADGKSWLNEPRISAPQASLETLSIRADANGTFAVGLPFAGWWGIAALDLIPGSRFEGKPLSEDAVIWVEATATAAALTPSATPASDPR